MGLYLVMTSLQIRWILVIFSASMVDNRLACYPKVDIKYFEISNIWIKENKKNKKKSVR